MAEMNKSELRRSIGEILKGADLSSLSSKKVRKQLEEKYEVDLTERKKEIDEIVMDMITNSSQTESQTETEEEKVVEQNGTKQESSSDDEAPDPEPVAKKKKTATPARKNTKPSTPSKNSSEDEDDDDDDDGVDDEKLAKKLQEEESAGRRTRTRAVKRNPPKAKPKSTEKKKGSKPGQSRYSKPCQLSPDLAAIVGTDKLPRKDVVKRMWEIVKERKLEDPKNRQFMVCDEEMQKLFGRKRVRTFGMMKYLNTHIWDAN
ncbi:upstream activation factor subunit spp27 [Lingula anatina]|uniref:Upstream activation factor subunit spp27 n=1 Tax=Lingula anatina TaxID=7574 RepID=A0A1S3JSK3_LINAN|nr:upstream activation factor subunit spp27 [Lingula anatina]|eukprot:XP_013413350.1 upstream activation factor subunit spp27 [Lingula anatina]